MWYAAAAVKAVNMVELIPPFIGSKPLLIGKNAAPHPPTAPHMIGPKMGNECTLAGMEDAAADVSPHTTNALTISKGTTTIVLEINEKLRKCRKCETLKKRVQLRTTRDTKILTLNMGERS